jgi:hypothetical protein
MMIAEKRDRRNRQRSRCLRGDAVVAFVLMTILLPALFPASGGAYPPLTGRNPDAQTGGDPCS